MFVLEMDAIELAFREVRCPLCQSCDWVRSWSPCICY